MKPIEIKKDVYALSAVDWNLRDFHGYETENGSTYNAYLVKGTDKTVLFDTVKAEFAGEFIAALKSIIDPEKIDYIVSNHSEMDHTGALPKVLEVVKPAKLLTTKRGVDTLQGHFHLDDWPFEIINKDQPLDLGGKTVRFIASPMLHWPESMVSFIPEDGVLISNDIFGQHWATSERFDDEVSRGELRRQAAKYFANIFYPVSAGMKRFVGKLKSGEMKLEMLAVDHGLIWRKYIPEILDLYEGWSTGQTEHKAVIVFDTMWGSTGMMARAVADGLIEKGVSVKLMDLHHNHRSDVITEILESRAVVVGSPILNKEILPKMADILTYMKGLDPAKGKIAGSFGSYGWSDTITKMINERLDGMNFERVDDGLSINYVPDTAGLKACFDYGVKIAGAM